MSESNRAGCACPPEDATLAEVVWFDGSAGRVTCGLCGSTRPLVATFDTDRDSCACGQVHVDDLQVLVDDGLAHAAAACLLVDVRHDPGQ